MSKLYWIDYSASMQISADNEDEAIKKAYEVIIGEFVEVSSVEEIEDED